MRNLLLLLIIVLINLLLFNCAAKLKIAETKALPQSAGAGDETTFMVKVDGPIQKINKIDVTVREYPEMVVALNDSGEEGDEKSGDGMWSRKITIPWNAESGIYHLEVTAMDVDGNEIISQGFENQSFGKSGVIEITVK
jgi:hypothetical protein